MAQGRGQPPQGRLSLGWGGGGGSRETPSSWGSDPQGEDERCKAKTQCQCTGRAYWERSGDTLGQPHGTWTRSDTDFQAPRVPVAPKVVCQHSPDPIDAGAT